MSEWISIKDRLPETIPCNAGTEYSEAVVVLTEDRIVCTAIWNGETWIGDFDYWEADWRTVTHWKSVLPLPEPPEAENGTLKPCPFCVEHCRGDTLYESSSWDGGIGYDYVRPIKFCPLCGKRLQTEEEWKCFYDGGLKNEQID